MMNPHVVPWLNLTAGVFLILFFGALGYDYLVDTPRTGEGISYWFFPISAALGVVAGITIAVLKGPF